MTAIALGSLSSLRVYLLCVHSATLLLLSLASSHCDKYIIKAGRLKSAVGDEGDTLHTTFVQFQVWNPQKEHPYSNYTQR